MVKQKTKLNKAIFSLILLPIILSGCIINIKNTNDPSGILGSFFISNDQGDTWTSRNNIYTANGSVSNFSGANVTMIAFDPQDANAIYVGTQTNGIYYTYNLGQGWFNTLVNQGTINDIVVNPANKCTIYAAVHNKIWQTDDCFRTVDFIYFEARPNQFVRALAINYENPEIIYAGTNSGSLLISRDGGATWNVLFRFDDDIKDIVIQNHSNSNIIYVATKAKGVFRSEDQGQTWQDLMTQPAFEYDDSKTNVDPIAAIKLKDEPVTFSKISGSKTAIAIESDQSQPDSLLYANRVGIFRLIDNHWEQIKLLTPDKKDSIYSIAINPLDGNELYYGTNTAFYHTVDGGLNWQIKTLPSGRIANALELSPNGNYMYLGTLVINE